MAIKVHFSKTRPNAFGGTTTGTLCNRLRLLADGMNCTTDHSQVTCSFCLRIMKAQVKAQERNAA